MLRLTLICLMLLGASSSVAGNTAHTALTDTASAQEWQAVGRLDIEDAGFCTATLIADRLILTAAHCVHSSRTGKIVAPSALVFKAGFRDGKATAIRKGQRMIIHSDYVHNSPKRVRNVPFDIAVIELDRPIHGNDVKPFDLHDKPQLDQDVTVVSYARGRAGAASMERGCKMFNSFVGALIYTCDVDFGSSGAPVFITTPNGPQIASVITSKSKLDDKKVALGAPLETALSGLLARLASSDPRVTLVTAAVSDQQIKHSAARVTAMLSREMTSINKPPKISN